MSTRTLHSIIHHGRGFLIWKSQNRSQQTEIAEFLLIGRDASSPVYLEDPFASARHARIERKPNGFILRDMRSRNGTYLNGSKIIEAPLHDGDRIRVGHTDLYFCYDPVSEELLHAPLSSKNPAWNTQLQRLPQMALAQFPVLLTGPSGTGKDVLAQAIHRLSARRSGPFISVNCSALSESLVESELFGHVKGSFTGATDDRKGAFEAARGGSLFLDEIGDLPLSLQPKLLRALENLQIRPVGSDHSIQTDVRILAATHHELRRLVAEERFRADLYFRLNVIQVQTPSLMERREDFEDLFYYFAKTTRVRFSHGAIQKLKAHTWPGNIRELKNVIARAKAFWGSEEILEEHVAELMDVDQLDPAPAHESFKANRSVIKEIEYEMIKSRLIANRGNQRKTASDLGMPKSTLHDRIRVYGIDVEKLLDGRNG